MAFYWIPSFKCQPISVKWSFYLHNPLCIIFLSWVKWTTQLSLRKHLSHPMLQWEITILSRPHGIRLGKLTLGKQGVHTDFSIHIDFPRPKSKLRARVPWMSLRTLLHHGTWILNYPALQRSYEAFSNSETERNFWCPNRADQKIERYPGNRRLETSGYPPAWRQNYKTEKGTKRFYLLPVIYCPFSWWIWWEHTGWWNDAFSVQRKVVLLL